LPAKSLFSPIGGTTTSSQSYRGRAFPGRNERNVSEKFTDNRAAGEVLSRGKNSKFLGGGSENPESQQKKIWRKEVKLQKEEEGRGVKSKFHHRGGKEHECGLFDPGKGEGEVHGA